MKVSFAKFISTILNPLVVMFFAPFFLIYRTTHDFDTALYWAFVTLIFLMVMGLFVIAGVKKKIFTDLDISRREQRPLMFLMAILFVSVYILTVFALHGPYILYVLGIGIILGVSVVSVINRRVKASIHVATLTALVLPVAVSFGHYYILLLLLVPLVAWSRLVTKRHSLREIFVGGTVGGLISLSIYLTVRFFLHR